MQTKIIRIEDKAPVREELLLEAARILREGGLVAFPTETVYGLGGNALDAEASRKIYAAKGRPSDNPLIVHIACMEELAPLVEEISESAKRLADAYWPGPMTLILKKSGMIPPETSGGLDTVAIRMPADPVAGALIRLAGVPVAAPSANTSGKPSPTTAEHVIEDMDGRVEVILDGGPVQVGVESTIVDLSGEHPVLLRPGAVTVPMLEKILGPVELDPVLTKPLGPDVHPKAPGMKYRHYAPRAEMILVESEAASAGENAADAGLRVVQEINLLAEKAVKEGKRPGILATDETAPLYRFGEVRSIGLRSDEASVARNLFAVLREFDSIGVDIIYSEAFPEDDLGLAIMNRMNKAAGHHHIVVSEDGSTTETLGG
ncbi:MAG: threonylcarbamoyl-AMP synthase [Stomatobaculum sp.]|nr:threonylcarbamoyl-AMP synthase [Stomatobaculum sp.]